jgi:excisionase family DNA binding protein
MTSALHTMDEAAKKLRVSRRWLQDFIQDHPYYRMAGRKKLFSEEDITRLQGALPCPGSSSRPEKARRRIGTSAGSTSDSLWTRARELLTNGRRGASSSYGESRPNVVSLPRSRIRVRRQQHFLSAAVAYMEAGGEAQ